MNAAHFNGCFVLRIIKQNKRGVAESGQKCPFIKRDEKTFFVVVVVVVKDIF